MDVKRMYCMIEKLAECADKQFDAGIENIDTSEMGQVVDMMKDLAEAMYYRELTKAMQEFDAEDVMEMLDRYGDGRKFYDHYRYADGRFAPEEITEELFEGYLDTHGIPDPDLLIRTSGELRLSNYLLWQLAYTEFYFTDVPWPDFSKEELEKAIEQYNSRDRRYGGIKEDEENV